jgi:hypothetical protein
MNERPVDVGDWDPRDMDARHAHDPRDDRPTPAELAEWDGERRSLLHDRAELANWTDRMKDALEAIIEGLSDYGEGGAAALSPQDVVAIARKALRP